MVRKKLLIGGLLIGAAGAAVYLACTFRSHGSSFAPLGTDETDGTPAFAPKPIGSREEHLVLHRLLLEAGWPHARAGYGVDTDHKGYAWMLIGGKEVRMELAPDRALDDQHFVIASYDGEPLDEHHPLHMMDPPYTAVLASLCD